MSEVTEGGNVRPDAGGADEDGLRAIVRFSRKCKAAGDFGMAEFSVSLPVPISLDESEDSIIQRVRQTSTIVKALVLEEMGLPYTLSQQTGMVMESTPYSALLDSTPAAAPTATVQRTSLPDTKPGHVAQDLWDDLQANPQNWTDNRPKKQSGDYKPTAADFKRKADGKSIWLAPKGK